MKQSTLLLAAAATLLLAGSTSAQTVSGPFSRVKRDIVRETRPLTSAAPPEWRFIDSLSNGFSFNSHGADPFSYDPRLNILAVAKRGAARQEGGGDRIWIFSSTDLGMTWAAPFGPFTDPTAPNAGVSRYPTVIVNPKHSTTTEEFVYYYHAPMNDGVKWIVHSIGLIDQDGQELISQELTEKIGRANWGDGGRSVETLDGTKIITAGPLSDNSIGIRVFDLGTGEITQQVPAATDSAKFDPPQDENSKTSSPVGIGTDASGGIHVLYVGNSRAERVVLGDTMPMKYIIKSVDNGATWSAAIPLPVETIKAYMDAQGWAAGDSTGMTFGPHGFAVLGPERYSIVFTFYNDKSTGSRHQLLEARYNAGNWNIFKIADINAYMPLDGGDGDFANQQMESEVQMAKTADGRTLLAKWNQLVSYTIEGDIDDDGDMPDTLVTSDVFVASRAVSQGTWSEPKNVTQSAELDRLTWIPSHVIPNDLTQLPLLEVQGVIDEALDVTQEKRWVDGQWVLDGRPQLVMNTNVDATPIATSAPVAGEATASRITSIVPNPTNGSAVVTVNVAKTGSGSVDIWNALGVRVASLASGTLRSGINNYSLNGVRLPVGAYYIAMTIDGETLTQPFIVAR